MLLGAFPHQVFENTRDKVRTAIHDRFPVRHENLSRKLCEIVVVNDHLLVNALPTPRSDPLVHAPPQAFSATETVESAIAMNTGTLLELAPQAFEWVTLTRKARVSARYDAARPGTSA